jgi:hypothetical protein
MAENRKISDVIIDLEAKINRMAGLFQNLDNNIKLILNKLNNQPQQTAWVPPSAGKVTVAPKNAPPVTSGALIAEPYEESPIDHLKGPEIEEEVVHKGKRRGRVPADPSQSTKIAVSQQIVYPDGKNLFLASVEIFDADGNLVKQVRTNTNGRWIAPLDQGEYTIHVLKRMDNSNKLPVELRYKVIIPNSTGPMELPSPSFGGQYE